MKSYDELNKAEMESLQQQMVEAKKNKRANAEKGIKRHCKEFGFMLNITKKLYPRSLIKGLAKVLPIGLYLMIKVRK